MTGHPAGFMASKCVVHFLYVNPTPGECKLQTSNITLVRIWGVEKAAADDVLCFIYTGC